jgi:hypothetical protein
MHSRSSGLDQARVDANCFGDASTGRFTGRKVKSITLEKIQQYAKSKGGECLSETYSGPTDLIRLRCQRGHEWECGVYMIYGNNWCKSCYHLSKKGTSRVSPEEISRKMNDSGYVAVGKAPSQMSEKVEMVHNCGTKIVSTVREVCRGNPCPQCNGSLGMTEEACQIYAKNRGGGLVSWAGAKATRSVFRCHLGHMWQTNWSSMKKHSSWCPECANAKKFKGLTADPNLVKMRKQLNGYLARDQKTQKQFDLDLDFLIDARSKPCHYCSRPATGLDRIDNSKGHLKSNCVPACIRCNWVRGNYLSFQVMEKVGELLREIDP